MTKVKENRKIIKNLENLNESEVTIDESVSDASLEKLVSELKPNAGFPPLRLKKNNNIDNKTRAFQPNIRTILLDNQKTSFTKNNNDSELEIINSL
jgi:hypothetical protein